MKQTELDSILNTFFHHQIVLKMYHFQTKLYGAHKASDSYLADFSAQLDKFMEVAQGTWSTVTAKSVNLKVKTATDGTIQTYLDQFIDFLDTLEKTLGSGHSDLLNIRDEMKASAHQLKYLLRFK